MDWQAVNYPSCAAASVQFANQLFQYRSARIPVEQRVYTLECAPAERDYPACLALDCSLGEGALTLYLNEQALGALLNDTVSAQLFRTFPDACQTALLDAALGPLAQIIRNGAAAELRLRQVRETAAAIPAREGGLLLALGEPETGARHALLVRIEQALPAGVLTWFRQFSESSPANYGWLPVTVRLELGYSALSASELASLRSGAIVLCDTCYLAERQLRVTINDHLFCFVEVDGNRLTMQSHLQRVTEEMTDKNTAEGAQNDIADLPIDLVFLAGRLQLTVEELQRVQPGHVFDLGQNIDRHIEIRAGGVVIGRGELVEVGGRVGVRILECKT